MAGWVEQTTTLEWEKSIDGFYHAVRRFRVWGYHRTTIGTTPDICSNDAGFFLPKVGDREDNTPSGDSIPIADTGEFVYCYRLKTTALDEPRFTDCEFLYSNDTRIISNIPDQVSSFQTEHMSMPVGIKVLRTNAGTNTVSAFVQRPIPFPYTVGRYTRDCLIRRVDRLTAARVARGMVNQLHKVQTSFTGGAVPNAGRLFRFEGPEFREYSPRYDLCRYSWWYDGGHKELRLIGDAQAQVEVRRPPQSLLFDGDEWVRPPYHTLEMLKPNGGNADAAPIFAAFCTYEINEDGWLSLVGIT